VELAQDHVAGSERVGIEVSPLTRIRDVLASNLGRDMGYSDRFIVSLPSFFSQMTRLL
jgi:hypothetical protein